MGDIVDKSKGFTYKYKYSWELVAEKSDHLES